MSPPTGRPIDVSTLDLNQGERVCGVCSTVLVRGVAPSGRVEDLSKFRARRFCSRSCVNRSRVGMTYRKREALTRAIAEVPPPPCDTPVRCIHRDRCATDHLACGDFLQYASMDKNILPGRTPTAWRYTNLFGKASC